MVSVPEPLSPVRNFLMSYGSLIFLGLVMIGPAMSPSPLGLIMSPFNAATRWYVVTLLSLVG